MASCLGHFVLTAIYVYKDERFWNEGSLPNAPKRYGWTLISRR